MYSSLDELSIPRGALILYLKPQSNALLLLTRIFPTLRLLSVSLPILLNPNILYFLLIILFSFLIIKANLIWPFVKC